MTLWARAAASADELDGLLRLRATVFGASWMAGHCSIDAHGLEWDGVDQRSHHLGLWTSRRGGTPVAVARVVTRSLVPRTAAWMAGRAWSGPITAGLPALDDFGMAEPTPDTVEVSRFAVASTHRCRTVVQTFARAAFAFGTLVGGDRLVFRVPRRHAALYSHTVGARRVTEQVQLHHGVEVWLLEAGWHTLPAASTEATRQLAAALHEEGSARVPDPCSRCIESPSNA